MTASLSRILVIDDDDFLRENVREYLTECDFQVFDAEDGGGGLETLRQGPVDLVLLDLRMPDMDGLEVLKIITTDWPETPVIIVSGMGVMKDAVEALQLGAWDYLIKPIGNMAVLRHAVDKALERAQLIRENRQYREHLEEQVAKRTAELAKANNSLQTAVEATERKNVALQELMGSIQSQQTQLGTNITGGVERVILPMLNSLKSGLSHSQCNVVEQIEQSLGEIVSPFISQLSKVQDQLTPAEVRICNLIRRGLAAKQIAQIEHIAPGTVNRHRERIRHKLGLTNRKVNLAAFLQSLEDESAK